MRGACKRGWAALAGCLLVACAVEEAVHPAPTIAPDAGTAALETPGRCVRTCTVAAECCTTRLCTGVGYTCNEGLCEDEQCRDDGDCAIEGELSIRRCRVVGGRAGCYVPCTGDRDCENILPAFEDLKCVGTADDGSRYCDAAELPPECTGGADAWSECPGWRSPNEACVAGACVCTSSAECLDGYVCTPR